KEMSTWDRGEFTDLLYTGRYIITLNGLFAFYCGFVYNDCFALGLALFTPTWYPPEEHGRLLQNTTDDVREFWNRDPTNPQVYPMGADTTWHISGNEIQFFNSMKMKTAVLIGVFQMVVGIFLKGFNALHFSPKGKLNLDLWFEAIPQF